MGSFPPERIVIDSTLGVDLSAREPPGPVAEVLISDILEVDLRDRPDVDLERDDARLVEFRVGAVDDPRAVEVDGDVVSLGGDDELVPVLDLDQFLGFLFRVPFEDPAAFFLVEQAPVAVGDVGLRARDDTVGGALASELDARIAAEELDLGLEHGVAVRAPSPTRNRFF